ncbi:MAG: sulfatase [Acidobacteria bacterium]|nr:sulfatase [Acidobacteriota bacterium]
MNRISRPRRGAAPKSSQPRRPTGHRRDWRAATATACGLSALVVLACGGAAERFQTDLAQALDLAEVTAESSEVAPGNYEQRRQLREGWSAPGEDEGGSFASGEGDRSTLNWHLSWSRPLELVLTGRQMASPGTEPPTVRVSWNQQPLGQLDLASGGAVEEYRLSVPPAVQRQGDNDVLLEYSSPAGAVPPRVAWSRIRIEGAGTGARPSAAADGTLHLPFRTALDYYVLLPEGGVLELDDLGLYGPQGVWRGAEPSPRLVAAVHRYPTGSAAATTTLSGGRGQLQLPAHESPLRIRIEALAGARLPEAEAGFRLSAVLSSPTPPWPHAEAPFANPAEPAEAQPVETGEGFAGASDPSGAHLPHILIFLVDTLRADHLGCYGYERPTSPNIDRFAGDAILFEHAVAQSSWTRPATASILTGLYPHRHGARTRNQELGADIPYLPEILSSLGYRALGVSTNGNAGIDFGFRRGFNHFMQMRERASRPGIHVPVWRAVDETLEWLERIGPEDSFFVFLHVTDPHESYLPPEDHRQRFAPDAAAGPGLLRQNQPASASHSTSDLKDLYDGEIAFVDEHFGRMLEELDRRGFLEDTLVVFVSDHGEEFLDHGRHGHGATLYQEQIHVPLIIRLPGGLRRDADRSEVGAQVRQIDIVPTILDAIGAPGLAETDGQSLLPLIRSGADPRGSTVAMAELRVDRLAMDALLLHGVDRRHKLIDYHSTPSGTARQLFDAGRDRAELNDLRQEESLWAGYLAAVGKLQRRGAGPLTAGIEPSIPPEQREALKALGYLD